MIKYNICQVVNNDFCKGEKDLTPSVPMNCIQFPLWDVPPIVYVPKVVNFYNIKHNYTHYFPPLSPFYNNINTITPTTLLHYLKFIIKYKWVPPLYPLFIQLYSFLTQFLGLRVPTICIQMTGTEGVYFFSIYMYKKFNIN